MNIKNSGKISGCLIIVIILLIALAVGLSMSGSANDMVDDYYSGDAAKQISLEIKKKQPMVNYSAVFEGMGEKDVEELFYIVRVNHDIDMEMSFKIDVIKAEDGIDEALKLKVYDSTDEKVIYDDKLAQLDEKVYEELQLANASKKSDTRYEMTLYFDQEVGERFEESAVALEFSWFVSDDDAELLEDVLPEVELLEDDTPPLYMTSLCPTRMSLLRRLFHLLICATVHLCLLAILPR